MIILKICAVYVKLFVTKMNAEMLLFCAVISPRQRATKEYDI